MKHRNDKAAGHSIREVRLVRNALLATGRFLTILPLTVLHFGERSMSLKKVPVNCPVRSYPVGIITLKNRTLNPVARLFIDCAREVSKPFERGK